LSFRIFPFSHTLKDGSPGVLIKFFGYEVDRMSSLKEHSQFSEYSGYWEGGLKALYLCLLFFPKPVLF